jgi:hypothetical protein
LFCGLVCSAFTEVTLPGDGRNSSLVKTPSSAFAFLQKTISVQKITKKATQKMLRGDSVQLSSQVFHAIQENTDLMFFNMINSK